MKPLRSSLLAVATLALSCTAAIAEPPVQMMVPYDPGSATDVVARAMQPTLSAKLDRSVVVINKPGASGTLGTEYLARAKPDGRSLGLLTMASILMVPQFRKLTYDLGSFDYLCQIYSAPVVIMVAPDSPYKDIHQLLEFGKANPGALFYGSPGIGTPDHINMANFLRQNGVVGTHVPYAGGGAVSQALMTKQIIATSNTTVTLNAYHLRPLVVLSNGRLPELPDVPTAGEIGPKIDTSIWSVMAAPKGLAPEMKASFEQACKATLDDPGYRKTALNAGFPPYFRSGEALPAFLGEEFKRAGDQIKAEGLDLQ